jgi:head-tail adaptor
VLTAADLTRMRAVAEQAMPGTAVIQGGTLASDGGGGWTETFAPRSGGTVACRVAPVTGTEREIGGRIHADAEYVITLPAATTVETDDRIVVGAITYNVVAVRDRSWEISRRVEARRID